MSAQTVVQSSTATTYYGMINNTYLQYAKDAVEGYTGEYYFFRYDDNEYVLLLFDEYTLTEYGTGWTLAAESPEVIVFDRIQTTINGYQTSIAYRETHANYDGVLTVQNYDGIVSYASLENFPHLIEGVQNYEYAQILILCMCVCFVLLDRVYAHVRSIHG